MPDYGTTRDQTKNLIAFATCTDTRKRKILYEKKDVGADDVTGNPRTLKLKSVKKSAPKKITYPHSPLHRNN